MKKITIHFKLAIAVLLFVLIFPVHHSSAQSVAPTWVSPVDYVALGDSLAAGVTPENELGKSYADYISHAMQQLGTLQSYNKGFTYPGYTTTDVLRDIQADVVRDVVGIGYDSETAQLKSSIANAEIITISAGANDVLAHVEIDETGEITVDHVQLVSALQQVAINYQAILNEIYALNSDAKLYIMGYYNPFPYLADDAQPLLNQLLNQLNGAIANSIAPSNAIFIETADEIATDFPTYLPNPANIHLSEAGYAKVAQLFWDEVKDFPWIPENVLVANEITADSVQLTWKPATSTHRIVNYELYQDDVKIATIDGDILTYSVEGLSSDTNYQFSLRAIDETSLESNENPTITITTTTIEPTFSDVREELAIEYVERGVALGLIKGYDDGTFKPYNSLTRVQAASILARALNLQTSEQAPFKDIAGIDEEIQAEINAAYAAGLIKGHDGSFMPYKEITRAQMALMIHRAIEFKTGEHFTVTFPAPYVDIDAYDEEAVNAISVLYELEIATGSNGNYMPSSHTTRQQAMKFFVNTVDLLELED